MHRANAALLELIENDMTWEWSLQLLNSDDEFVRFFSANILLTKVKRHWALLEKGQRSDVFTFLFNTLQTFGMALLNSSNQFDAQALQSLRVSTTMIFAVIHLTQGSFL